MMPLKQQQNAVIHHTAHTMTQLTACMDKASTQSPAFHVLMASPPPQSRLPMEEPEGVKGHS